jgi:hypothetical protein
MIMYGSLSHLSKRGLENYTEECVKIKKVLSNMVPKSCITTHVVFVPLGGVEGGGLIRDLYDFDSWLRSSGHGGDALPGARACFWDIVHNKSSAGGTPDMTNHGTRTMYMPESLHSSSKIRTVSGSPHVLLPVKISPFDEKDEMTLITCLMREINDTYALNVPEQPCLDRSSGVTNSGSGKASGRIFTIGGSHVKRIVGGLESLNMDVVDLSRPGWKADPEQIAEVASKLKRYGLSDADIIVVDILSNSIICGTDSRGMPIDQSKINGSWHVTGSLSFVPKTVIKSILATASDLIFTGSEPRIIAIMPLPRYVTGKCCADPDHIKNMNDADYTADFEQNLEQIEDILSGWIQSINSRSEILHFRTVTDNPEAPLPELLVNGEPLWPANDPVHGSAAYYSEISATLAESVRAVILDEGGQPPPPKRQRLESVVVRREGESVASPARRHNASWSTGILPASRGRGGKERGSFHRGSHARGRWRGWRRPFRGRGRGGH